MRLITDRKFCMGICFGRRDLPEGKVICEGKNPVLDTLSSLILLLNDIIFEILNQ